jgi:Flp pilus assembly pilin Flp
MLGHLRRDDGGAAMVEFTLVAVLLFAVTFGIVEFGLVLFNWTLSEKATERGTRLAVVRPALAASVPEFYERDPAATPLPRFGTPCNDPSGPCLAVPRRECVLSVANGSQIGGACDGSAAAVAARNEIIGQMRALSPLALRVGGAGQIAFVYDDAGLGFLGGPYVPAVTVEVQNVPFQFLVLGPLVRLLGGAFTDTITMPTMRTTAIGEDLNVGENG